MMSNRMAVLMNGELQLEFHRDRAIPDKQREYLDKMDRDMDQGISVAGEQVVNPDQNQRAQFVAVAMFDALMNNEEPLIAATCTYLADRLPELKQVKAVQEGEEIVIDMVFDEEYQNQVKVEFNPGMFH